MRRLLLVFAVVAALGKYGLAGTGSAMFVIVIVAVGALLEASTNRLLPAATCSFRSTLARLR